ncbi:MAG: RDD family protein [Candidatus Bathyarchaeia archaeon]
MEYQGIAVRFAAQLVDGVILGIVYFLLRFGMTGSFSFDLFGAGALTLLAAWWLISLLYFAILEGTKGATIGKMLLKIKVVQEDGKPCGIVPAFVRNILRIVDALPILYIIGILLISRSDKKQRLGDRVAKTVVIKA